jgi:hypothetical protein
MWMETPVLHPLIGRLRAEYLEMPGLRLTALQARRLCGGEDAFCQAALDQLVDERFLDRRSDGSYSRVSDGPRRRR